jgi:hypothetical protein
MYGDSNRDCTWPFLATSNFIFDDLTFTEFLNGHTLKL